MILCNCSLEAEDMKLLMKNKRNLRTRFVETTKIKIISYKGFPHHDNLTPQKPLVKRYIALIIYNSKMFVKTL